MSAPGAGIAGAGGLATGEASDAKHSDASPPAAAPRFDKQAAQPPSAGQPWEHRCGKPGCRAWGPFGQGSLRNPAAMRWWCGKHRPEPVALAVPVEPLPGLVEVRRQQGKLL